ncbi:MAG: cytochrome c biogenesis protein [Candidatus Krumholzibacteriia bacterium]
MSNLRRAAVVAATAALLITTIAGNAARRGRAAAQTGGHTHGHTAPDGNFLTPYARDALGLLMVQDFQGRMKPLDTLSRESVMKVTKRGRFEGWNAMDLSLSWLAHSRDWFDKPVVAVRNAGVKSILGVDAGTTHVTPASLYDASGQYRLAGEVDAAHRVPDKEKTKTQKKLVSFDERFNFFHMALRGITLRLFPVPGDENNRWIAPRDIPSEVPGEVGEQYQAAFEELFHALQEGDNTIILQGARTIRALQEQHGATVIPSERARHAEMWLNRTQPFTWATIPYLFAFAILILAYAWGLARRRGRAYSLRHPFYALGMLLYAGTLAYHTYAYVLRWIASGHAPLSNGYESLIFISLMIGAAGFYYEMRTRGGSVAALAGLLTSVILGVAMLPTFDPAISPLVPVLASFWLIVHVTVITASYGFLGLAALVAMTMLILHLFKGPDRMTLRLAILELNSLHWRVMITGLAFLSIGTWLGGVWANESWGRYWGWDPKETWALVTILVYAFVAHMRFVETLNNPLNLAAGSFAAISSVGMTYFGVNYFLSGLHSYAQGDAPSVPGWVYVMAVMMVALILGAYAADGRRSWGGIGDDTGGAFGAAPVRRV